MRPGKSKFSRGPPVSIEIGTLLVCSLDVCGGRLRINGTRITFNQLVVWYERGYTPGEIAGRYQHLTLAQVYTALAYYHENREDIEVDLAAEKMKAARLEQVHQQPLRRA
jgi:uncharacterized protein (DUF433 family)